MVPAHALTGSLLRSVPLGLAAALGLERPLFMGCWVGGLLALFRNRPPLPEGD